MGIRPVVRRRTNCAAIVSRGQLDDNRAPGASAIRIQRRSFVACHGQGTPRAVREPRMAGKPGGTDCRVEVAVRAGGVSCGSNA